jgi:hypothetical protein
MRFQYIDDKGKKVDLQSVEALAARISLGAVRDEMELYDAVADRWAPAADHEVFQQLKLEAGGGSATISPLIGAAHAEREEKPIDAPGAQPEDGEASTEPAGQEAAADGGHEADDATEPEDEDDFDILSGDGDMGLTLVDTPEPPSEDAAPEASSGATAGTAGDSGGGDFDLGLEGMELAHEDAEDETGPEGAASEGDVDSLFAEEDSIEIGADAGSADGGALEGLEPAGDYGMGGGDFFEAPDSGPRDAFEVEGFETGTGPVEGFESGPAETESFELGAAPPVGAAGWAGAGDDDGADPDGFITDRDPFAAPRGDGGGPEQAPPPEPPPPPSPEEGERIRSRAEARKEAARAKAEDRMRDSAPAAVEPSGSGGAMRLILLVAVGAVVVGGGTLVALRQFSPTTFASGPQADVPPEPAVLLPDPPTLGPEEGESLGTALTAGATASLALMDTLRMSAELGEGPPVEWLQGRYLAQASTFPEVQEYFRRASSMWSGNRNTLADRFVSAAMESLLAGGMSEDEAQALLDRSGRWTLPVEMDLEAVAESSLSGADAALDLHAYLVSVEDRIEYDPFDQPGVPADPVVEAVPQDPEVEAEMWDRIGAVADAFRDTELLLTGFGDRAAARADSVRASAGA